ncbi:MAG: carbohydrate-binding domain-containing protein [Clostridium sp.]|nr:carbohydrate-binding domain-containing protein [Clostridium sp.]
MSTHKKIDFICIGAILAAVIITILFINGRHFGIVPVVNADADGSLFTENDRNADWDTASATQIILSDTGSTVKGNGAYGYGGDVFIISAGYYVLTGDLTDGSVIIDADKNDKIWILLDGVTIRCEEGAAIRIEQADKVFLTLADGTKNTISAGAQYDAEIIAAGVDGAVYSRDDLTINGAGALTVIGEYQHGIVCNDDLVIAGGELTIRAVQDGIHANDSVRIRSAAITVSAGDDGITVSNDDDTAFLYMESGNVTITDCYEGLEAIDITIAGGSVSIMPTDDGINANGNGRNSVIRITGGDIAIINESGRDADGLDSNGDIYIDGGSLLISVSNSGGNCAIDYGSENGGVCVISGGTVIACGSSTMAESPDAGSTQGFLVYQGTAAGAGTTVSLMDSAGSEILSAEIPCSFSYMVLSAPELKIGDTCTVVVGGVEEQMTVDNTSSGFGTRGGGAFGGGAFGGGMRHGTPAQTGGRDFSGGQGMEAPDGQGMEAPDGQGMEPPDGQGMEAPDGQGMEPPGGQEMEAPGGQGMEAPDDEEMSEAGAEPFVPGGGQTRRNGMRTAWQEQGGTETGVEHPDFGNAVEVLVLIGVSLLVLIGGIAVAVKTKH